MTLEIYSTPVQYSNSLHLQLLATMNFTKDFQAFWLSNFFCDGNSAIYNHGCAFSSTVLNQLKVEINEFLAIATKNLMIFLLV